MKFAEDRKINRIQVPVTSICNRQCPDCCARERLIWYNKSISKKEVSLDELRRVGEIIGKIDRIEITGGEPTLHSRFEELTNNLPNIFQCGDFMLVTNGWLFGKDPSKLSLLLKYQRVWITHYTEMFVKKYGGVTNTSEYDLVSKFLEEQKHPQVMRIEVDTHSPLVEPAHGGVPCRHYSSGMIAYYEGGLYGCCVAWSLPFQGSSIPLAPGWREHLNEITLPCEQCPLSWRIS